MSIIRSLKNHPVPFVTVQELAEYTGQSTRTLQRAIIKGSLPARQLPGDRRWRILLADAQRYVGSTGETK